MGVRDRLSGGFTRLAKVFGSTEPPQITVGEAAAGMTPARPFSPGEPIGPYDGFSRHPRTQNFATGYNISARPRSHERVAFDTLKGLIDAYDVAQMCIWHRIDSIRALEWNLVAADGHGGDVSDAIALGMAALAKPDRDLPFASWLSAYLYDILAYDAGTLYRMRNRAGRAVGLRVVDGTTVAPLLDYWGNPPEEPAEAYVQYVNGLPWNWLTRRDLVYVPFRKTSGSPYGKAPLESILLNANTDLRFQAYFLQRFTEGNIPAAFASAPETWTPQQIEAFQEYWDAFILGDQAAKSQIKWIPSGSKIEFSNQHDFSDQFSLFLMRKTAGAYHVVPSDMGFTETVNRSSGETQSDVQHRIGDTPLAKHVSGVLTSFLQDDLGLPVRHKFDLGEEQDDRLQTAQADDLYIKSGVVGASEIREMRFGLPEPGGKPVPRYIYTTRGGPIPLAALQAVAGPVDQATGAPDQGAEPSHDAFRPIEGVVPVPPLTSPPLAEQIYGLTAADDPQVVGGMTQPVDKEGAPTAGITVATGITSYDLVGYHKNDDEDEQSAALPDPTIIKGDGAAELAAFRRYVKQRRRLERPWRDFDFRVVDRATARELNGGARDAVRKTATGTPGLTKRSGMISLDLPGGTIDPVPGGVTDHHITVVYLGKDLDDDAFANASERAKAAAQAVPGPLTGVIGGIDTFEASAGSDDKTPAFAPVVLPGVEKLRAALEDLSASEHRDYHPHVTLAYLDEGDPLPDGVPATPVTFTHLTVHRGTEAVSYPLGPPLTKAANGDPKGGAGKPADQWPGWKLDLAAAHYWAPRITATLTGALTAAQATHLARDYPASGTSPQDGDDQDAAALTAAALAWLTAQQIDLETPLSVTLDDLHTDGYLIGVICAHAVIDGADPDRGGWGHGDTDAAEAQIAGLGAIAGLDALRDETASRAQAMAQTRREHIARALALGAAGAEDPESIGDAMHDALIGGAIGVTIAITEITFASGLGALFGYGQRGVAMGQWVIDPRSKVCPRCLANAAAGPVPIGQPYPSGDTAAPIHPRCACAVLPA